MHVYVHVHMCVPELKFMIGFLLFYVQINEMGEVFGSYGEKCQCENTTSGACPKGQNGDICSGMCYFGPSYICTSCS